MKFNGIKGFVMKCIGFVSLLFLIVFLVAYKNKNNLMFSIFWKRLGPAIIALVLCTGLSFIIILFVKYLFDEKRGN